MNVANVCVGVLFFSVPIILVAAFLNLPVIQTITKDANTVWNMIAVKARTIFSRKKSPVSSVRWVILEILLLVLVWWGFPLGFEYLFPDSKSLTVIFKLGSCEVSFFLVEYFIVIVSLLMTYYCSYSVDKILTGTDVIVGTFSTIIYCVLISLYESTWLGKIESVIVCLIPISIDFALKVLFCFDDIKAFCNNQKNANRSSSCHKKKSKRKKVIIALALVMVPVITIIFSVIFDALYRPLSLSYGTFAASVVNPSSNLTNQDDRFVQICILGSDSRNDKSAARSDTIILCNIDRETFEITLVSIFRDTLMEQNDGRTFGKVNAAFARGGAECAVRELNRNMDTQITHYVVVDWKAVCEITDALGGIKINLSEEERKDINYRIKEDIKISGASTTAKKEKLRYSGKIMLDGVQTLGYCRIRKTKGDDFARSGRQQRVIHKLWKKIKRADLTTLLNIVSIVQRDIDTSLSTSDVMKLLLNISKFKIVATTGFPSVLTTSRVSDIGDSVIPCTLKDNVKILHRSVLKEKKYKASKTVKRISRKIIALTGVSSSSSTRSDVLNYFD